MMQQIGGVGTDEIFESGIRGVEVDPDDREVAIARIEAAAIAAQVQDANSISNVFKQFLHCFPS